IETRRWPLRPAETATRRYKVRIDRGVDELAGALHAGPIDDIEAGDELPTRHEFIARLQREFRDHRKLRLAARADIRRQRKGAAGERHCRAGESSRGRANDARVVDARAKSKLGAPCDPPRSFGNI